MRAAEPQSRADPRQRRLIVKDRQIVKQRLVMDGADVRRRLAGLLKVDATDRLTAEAVGAAAPVRQRPWNNRGNNRALPGLWGEIVWVWM